MSFGNFELVCLANNLPVCNVFRGNYQPYCVLKGVGNSPERNVQNPGDIAFTILAALVASWFIFRSQTKFAAVGRREMQILIFIYLLISIVQIFTMGGFITNIRLLAYFTALHIGFIVAFFWVLLLNAVVGYQLYEDGTIFSILMTTIPSLLMFIGSGYIVLDSMFYWSRSDVEDKNRLRNHGLYFFYFVWPVISIVGYFILEFILVFKILEEWRPLFL